MIGYLKGLITEVDIDSCIVDVQGVGYLVYCSEGTLFNLREKLGNASSLIKNIRGVGYKLED